MNSSQIDSKQLGTSTRASKGKRPSWPSVLLVLSLIAPETALAAAVLQDVQYSALPGDQVRIDLQFSEPIKAPRAFATDNPARVALDLNGVTSGLGKKRLPISTGPVQSLVAVEASDRTRVVINLNHPVRYEVSTAGDTVSIALNVPEPQAPPPESPAGSSAAPAAPPPVAAVPAVAPPAEPSAGDIQDVDFKPGPNGEGRVLIRLPSPDTRVSVSEKGRHVVAEIIDARLPSRLQRRLDVADSSTPVVSVETRPRGSDVEVDIETGTGYEYLAYQADELFTLEFRPVTKAAKPKNPKSQTGYAGDRLSLNFQDIEVRAVLQLLADFTGLNLVASDTVTGNITLRLKNVPWDQALEIILKTKGLSMRRTGNVIMVAPTEEIVAREEAELLASQKVEELAPLQSEFIQINYAKAPEIAALLKSGENELLTPERGQVTVDPRTNTLLVRDTASQLEMVRRLVARLDVPVRQVMIESRIVIANNDFARELGVRFGYSRFQANENDGTFNNFAGGKPGYIDGSGVLVPGIDNPAGVAPLIVDLPASAPSGAASFLLGKIGSYLLQLELSAMQAEGRGEVISSPRVVTSDQKQATIAVGQKIPYQEQSTESNATTTSFEDAVLKLDVTPQITPDQRIIMDLQVNKDSPNLALTIPGQPPAIDTRSVTTSVLVDNGETVVLGGVFERERSFNNEQVPWLGDLPVIGNLFKNTSKADKNSELLIFVTPKILKGSIAGR